MLIIKKYVHINLWSKNPDTEKLHVAQAHKWFLPSMFENIFYFKYT